MKLNKLFCAAFFLTFNFTKLVSAQENHYRLTDLHLLDGAYLMPTGINNAGMVSGYTGDQTIRWQNGQAHILPSLGGIDYMSAMPAAINNLGQVAGTSRARDGSLHTVMWNGNNIVDLGTGGGEFSTATAINSLGQVAGWAVLPVTDSVSKQSAVLWSDGKVILLQAVPDSGSSTALGINDAGLVTGSVCVGQGLAISCNAVVWNRTSQTTLTGLGGNFAEGNAINNAGQIAGTSSLDDGLFTRAVRWNGDAATNLGTLGGDYSYARAINNSGQIVGAATLAGNYDGYHATLWEGTKVIDLNTFLDEQSIADGWVLASAVGINDRGDIIGQAYKNGISHSYLLSAVPEPEMDSMLFLGLFAIRIFLNRRESTSTRKM